MTPAAVVRDERTIAIENASYRWAYLLLSFGMLASVAWRAFVRDESSWDLLALVVVAGVVVTAYQAAHRVLSRRWAMVTMAAVVVAMLLGVVLASGARGFAAARAAARAATAATAAAEASRR